MKKEDMELVCPKCGVDCQEGFIRIDTWRIEWGETFFNPEDGQWCQDKNYDGESGITPHGEIHCTACGYEERLKGEWDTRWGRDDFGWPVETCPKPNDEYNL